MRDTYKMMKDKLEFERRIIFLIEQIIKNEDNISEKEDKCSDLFYRGCIKHLFVSFD